MSQGGFCGISHLMENSIRHLERPKEGYYSVRFVRKGPQIPVELTFSDGKWLASVAGVAQNYAYTPDEVESEVMIALLSGKLSRHPFVKILAYGSKITKSEHARLMERRRWAMQNAPEDPCLHPYKPIDLTRLPSLW